MDDATIFSHVDHTLLKADCSWGQIKTLCDEAVTYKTASVCVPPAYVGRIHGTYGPSLVVCTVIGFPLGYDTTTAKLSAAACALAEGAAEIDMVVNLTDVKNGDFPRVTREIMAMKNLVGTRIVKVIIETCALTDEEKIALCGCVTEAGADFIKTSTGFGSGGATMEDVLLLGRHIGPQVRIKASGGIRTREEMVAYIEAGCARLGTSNAVKVLAGGQAEGY